MAKRHGVAAFVVGEVRVTFHPGAVLERPRPRTAAEAKADEKRLAQEQEELLFYSARPE